jgi:hypothetical protein
MNTKTIEERIATAVERFRNARQYDDITCCQLREFLAEEFSNPWLDLPGEPGHWWFRVGDINQVIRVEFNDDDRLYFADECGEIRYVQKSVGQWQRVIGPSEVRPCTK